MTLWEWILLTGAPQFIIYRLLEGPVMSLAKKTKNKYDDAIVQGLIDLMNHLRFKKRK